MVGRRIRLVRRLVLLAVLVCVLLVGCSGAEDGESRLPIRLTPRQPQ